MSKIYYMKQPVKLGDKVSINKHREKTLEDYENELFDESKRIYLNTGWVFEQMMYKWLKNNHPSAYWSIVLQRIANDLNGYNVINFNHRDRECIYNLSSRGVNGHCGPNEGCVYFYDREKAEKAIKIMGDKLDIIYKH